MKINHVLSHIGLEPLSISDAEINSLKGIEDASSGDLTFIANSSYNKFYSDTKASAIFISNNFPEDKLRKDIINIKTDDPYLAFIKSIELFYGKNEQHSEFISDKAVISKTSVIGKNNFISHNVIISDNSSIGENNYIAANSVIEKNVSVGNNCKIFSNVVIHENCILGNNITIQAGTIIGGDGFGNYRHPDGRFTKIPQRGNVVIEDDVEIGNNTTIDRGTIGSTRIGKGVKLDNQIQIAHNVEIGENTAIAAQVGIAGSAKIGKRCMIAGQAGIVGHITICDDVIIGASVGVSKSIDKPGIYTGYRAQPMKENLKEEVRIKNLEKLEARVKALEKLNNQQ